MSASIHSGAQPVGRNLQCYTIARTLRRSIIVSHGQSTNQAPPSPGAPARVRAERQGPTAVRADTKRP